MISVRLSIAGILAREGSLIAATDTGDKDGNDNGQLSLTTNSLLGSATQYRNEEQIINAFESLGARCSPNTALLKAMEAILDGDC
jgi:hypothetical protein